MIGRHRKGGQLPRGWRNGIDLVVVETVLLVERYSNAGLFRLSDVDEKGYRWVQLCVGHPYANRYGWQRLHRYLMQRRLGRALKPFEHVHHKDDAAKDTVNAWDLEVLEDIDHGRFHVNRRCNYIPGDMAESWCARDERGRFTKMPTASVNGSGSGQLEVAVG